MNLQILNLLKDDRTLGEKLKDQFFDILAEIKDFFILIKENTYDLLCGFLDPMIVNLLLIAIGVVLVMMIAITLINK